jgi:hypothetical protein
MLWSSNCRNDSTSGLEGVPAALLARELVDQQVRAGALPGWSALPLLRQIADLVGGQIPCADAEEPAAAFSRAALPSRAKA